MQFPLEIGCQQCQATVKITEDRYGELIQKGYSPAQAIDEVLGGEHGWKVSPLAGTLLCSDCKKANQTTP